MKLILDLILTLALGTVLVELAIMLPSIIKSLLSKFNNLK